MKYPVQPIPEPHKYPDLDTDPYFNSDRFKSIFKTEKDRQDFKERCLRGREEIKYTVGNRKEGYWYSTYKGNEKYPVFVNDRRLFHKRQLVLDAYDELVKSIWANHKEHPYTPGEDRTLTSDRHICFWMGSSPCRGCDLDFNGSRSFIYKNWEWPEGYRHYIAEHYVEPSDEWLKDVLGIEL